MFNVLAVTLTPEPPSASDRGRKGRRVRARAEAIIEILGPRDPIWGNHPLEAGTKGPAGLRPGKVALCASGDSRIAGQSLDIRIDPRATTGEINQARAPRVTQPSANAGEPVNA